MSAATARDYDAFAEALVSDGVLVDPYFDARPRFSMDPVWLSQPQWAALRRAAEAIAFAYHELSVLCAREPAHLDDFFALTRFQKLMWASSAPRWHGLARADFFMTHAGPGPDDGSGFALRCCELNSDTPTGHAEAVLLNAALSSAGTHAVDPNAGLEAAFCEMVTHVAHATLGPDFERVVGIVYPTDLNEDLPLVRLYERWLTTRGYTVLLGSPYNLTPHESGAPALFGVACPILLRHYKTDWWGEREPVWTHDAPFEDAEPLSRALALLFEATTANKCVVVNPFGAALTQNKRSLAFLWEHRRRFSEASQAAIARYIPYTVRVEALHPDQLIAERTRWVLKSDYGCEGDEVVLGPRCTDAEWADALRNAAPGRWVVQEHFDARTDDRGASVNYGVYLVAGQAAGLYCRTQVGPTDVEALSAPCFLEAQAAHAERQEPSA